jgi:hypothetical protein
MAHTRRDVLRFAGAVSPALRTPDADVEPGAFDSADDCARSKAFGLPALSAIPIRVDCGTTDRFASGARWPAVSGPAGTTWRSGNT